mgnify:CR=1 FL=1
MVRRCILVLRLVREADVEKLEELAREIKEELKPLLYMIPWAAEVEVVKVSSE